MRPEGIETVARRSARLRGGFLMLACVLCAAGCASTPSDASKEERRGPFRQVRPAVAFEMMRDNPEMPIFDLRAAEEFHGPRGHLYRARSLPLAELDQRVEEIWDLRDRTFLIYCRRDDCGRRGLDWMLSNGFDHAVLMHGGIDAWIEGGFGTVEKAEPEPSPAEQEPGPSSPKAP